MNKNVILLGLLAFAIYSPATLASDSQASHSLASEPQSSTSQTAAVTVSPSIADLTVTLQPQIVSETSSLGSALTAGASKIGPTIEPPQDALVASANESSLLFSSESGLVLSQASPETIEFVSAPPSVRYASQTPTLLDKMSQLFVSSNARDVHCLNITQKDVNEIEILVGRPLTKNDLCPSSGSKKKGHTFSLAISEHFKVSTATSNHIVEVAHDEAKKKKLDPRLVLAVIATESGFNPKAKSHAGALGLMQAIPKWHQDKLKALGISRSELFNVRENIMLGTSILREYINLSGGDVRRGLQRYNGSLKDPRQSYSKKVMKYYSQLFGR